jgi:hypothetical protein
LVVQLHKYQNTHTHTTRQLDTKSPPQTHQGFAATICYVSLETTMPQQDEESKKVTVVWLGSNKVITTFDFDVLQDEDDAPYALQELVAKAMSCPMEAARVLYKGADLARLFRSRPASELDTGVLQWSKLNDAWDLLEKDLSSTRCVTLHASLFPKLDVWLHYFFNSYLSSEVPFSNRAFVLAACSGCKTGSAFRRASDNLKADKEIALAACKNNGLSLCDASTELKADYDVVLQACSQNGAALRYASQELRANRNIVLAACRSNRHALQDASTELRADRDLVLEVCLQKGAALQHASEQLRADRDVVLAACRSNGRALQHASTELRADRDVVLAACRSYGHALQHASTELRADRDVVLAACRSDGYALQHASTELRADRDVVLAACLRQIPFVRLRCV